MAEGRIVARSDAKRGAVWRGRIGWVPPLHIELRAPVLGGIQNFVLSAVV
jgi:hypothetical protein